MDTSEVMQGMKVTWDHVPRGGYGYVVPVDGIVVRRTPSGRVTIQVQLRTGEKVTRTVDARNLRRRSDS